jgi:hypothetical protein
MSFGQPFGRPSWNPAICALAFGWRRLRNGGGAPNSFRARARLEPWASPTTNVDLILAALFELQLTRSAFDGDPDADRIPFACIAHDDILALVDKLGGDRDTALFGAFRDADETDEP